VETLASLAETLKYAYTNYSDDVFLHHSYHVPISGKGTKIQLAFRWFEDSRRRQWIFEQEANILHLP
jgi:hypothetical protein